ncbi:hypothetical protein ABIB80_005517 [Bradyrhizobium sp. i1.15.2]|uniref:HD domain-containing protein n=1 Tax=Bradyrhizobium sp. i1.15.2 TaxID=3156362 RepID=UPI0033931BAC
MTSDFRECEIWSRVFKNVDPKDVEKATRLKTSFIVFRERVKGILEKISSCLPNLTVHDITHIDALWDTAGLIVGSSYPLNPMEVYVLGDVMLAQKIALETCESSALAVARKFTPSRFLFSRSRPLR